MLKIDGFYLYELGWKINRVSQIEIWPRDGITLHTRSQALGYLYPARLALDEFMLRSVYRMRTLPQAAQEFRDLLDWAIEHCQQEDLSNTHPTPDVIFQLQEKHREFEAVLRAEFAAANIYLVSQQSAFDTATLIEVGELAFPNALAAKVPQAVQDLRQAMRCIAFVLPTAAAFHLHRANEIILGEYWDSVSDGKKRPDPQSLGKYIGELESNDFGRPDVISALRDIKNLHRNPTIHADRSLESIEEAIDLQGAIRAAVGAMLSGIPDLEAEEES